MEYNRTNSETPEILSEAIVASKRGPLARIGKQAMFKKLDLPYMWPTEKFL